MKKYMIPVVAMLLFAGVAGAQTTQKQPSKSTPVKKETAAKKSVAADKSTASVTSTKAGTDAKATTVNRKHHLKKTKPVTKTENK